MQETPLAGQHNLSTGFTSGEYSVLIYKDGGYVEARNLYGSAADFKTHAAALEFCGTFLQARVVKFHTDEWAALLAR